MHFFITFVGCFVNIYHFNTRQNLFLHSSHILQTSQIASPLLISLYFADALSLQQRSNSCFSVGPGSKTRDFGNITSGVQVTAALKVILGSKDDLEAKSSLASVHSSTYLCSSSSFYWLP